MIVVLAEVAIGLLADRAFERITASWRGANARMALAERLTTGLVAESDGLSARDGHFDADLLVAWLEVEVVLRALTEGTGLSGIDASGLAGAWRPGSYEHPRVLTPAETERAADLLAAIVVVGAVPDELRSELQVRYMQRLMTTLGCVATQADLESEVNELLLAIFATQEASTDRLEQVERRILERLDRLALVGAADLKSDVTRLKNVTAGELDRLDGGYVAIPGPDGGTMITRTIISQIEQAAAAGPVLVTGDPGAGKTVAVHHLARTVQACGGEVAFFHVGDLKAPSLGQLTAELGLEHSLYDVLAQWSPGSPKVLIIDSLDAARGDGQSELWRQLIEHVTTRLADWRVVATVRSWDLQHSRHLAKHFPTPPIVVGELDDVELSAAAASWPELTQLVTDAPAAFRSLVRNPYNLRLAAELLLEGTPLATLEGLDSQLQLLDSYWELRVTSGTGGG